MTTGPNPNFPYTVAVLNDDDFPASSRRLDTIGPSIAAAPLIQVTAVKAVGACSIFSPTASAAAANRTEGNPPPCMAMAYQTHPERTHWTLKRTKPPNTTANA